MPLTKEKMVTRLQTQLGLTKQESRQAMERLFEIMKDTLANGDDLLISGYGKFSVRQKNARRGRNPQTKETLMLKARKVLVFKAAGVLSVFVSWACSSRLHQLIIFQKV
jgi:integration host factor subunit alpha